MKVLLKTEDQLLKEGWGFDKEGDLYPSDSSSADVVVHMLGSLGKAVDLDENGYDNEGWYWHESTYMTKSEVINKFFQDEN